MESQMSAGHKARSHGISLIAQFVSLLLILTHTTIISPASTVADGLHLESAAGGTEVSTINITSKNANAEDKSPFSSPALKNGTDSNHSTTSSYSNIPLSFEGNRGQSPLRADFITRTSGYTLYLTSGGLSLKPNVIQGEGAAASKAGFYRPRGVNIRLVGAAPLAEAEGADELPGKINYFIGGDPRKWHSNIPTFARVHYKRIYPGIDVVYYGKGQEVEYDFSVYPGADPNMIQLGFDGPVRMRLDGAGSLIVETDGMVFTQHKPVAYQEINGGRKVISCRYVKRGRGRVGFLLGDYDKSKPLTIDPVISYSNYFGGSGLDEANSLTTDAAGNLYLTGSTSSSELTTTGSRDVYVAKFNSTGTERKYLTIIGGGGDDKGIDIALDGSGNAYVVGSTNSTDFPIASPLQPIYGGETDGFVIKLDPTGSTLSYSTYFGGAGEESAHGVAVDGAGSAYVVGFSDSTDFSSGNSDGFVLKLTPSGNQRSYYTSFGGSGSDRANDIAVDVVGSAYITGTTDSSDFTTKSPIQQENGGGDDAFVAKLNPSGSAFTYSTYLGSAGDEAGFGIAVDSSGNAYVTGSSDSQTQGNLGGNDIFVARYNTSGSDRAYYITFGGSGSDVGLAIAVDNSGNAYVTGTTDSPDFMTVAPAQPAFNGGGQDAFVAKVSPVGASILYATYLGGSGSDTGNGVVLDAAGNVYVAGFSKSPNLPSPGALQPDNKGDGDAFISKITETASGSAILQFGASAYSVSEDVVSIPITVLRTGGNDKAVTVNYVSGGGTASERSNYTRVLGTLRFAPGESIKVFNVLLTDNALVEGDKTVNLSLAQPSSGNSLGAPSNAVLTIRDNDTASQVGNPLDGSQFFVQQHYFDFLNRVTDASGYAFWTNEIEKCGTDEQCREVKRINVSAAFFLSIEFQQTGYLSYRAHKAAFGNFQGKPVPITRDEMLGDMQIIGSGIVVNAEGWEQALEQNKQSYFEQLSASERFAAVYPQTMTPESYVDALNTNAGGSLSQAERDSLVNDLKGGAKTRAQVLRAVTEDPDLNRAEFNRAFVLMQYFGYLRRNPDALPDHDFSGWQFWLNKLDQFNGNFIQAEMVKAFLNSDEYRKRFGQ